MFKADEAGCLSGHFDWCSSVEGMNNTSSPKEGSQLVEAKVVATMTES